MKRNPSFLSNPLLQQFASSMGYNNKKNRKSGNVFSNTDLAKMQWDYAQAIEEREYNEYLYNEYESPSAMMRQYQEAGLNPALMYGDASSGNVAYSHNAPSSGGGIGLGGSDETTFGTMSGILNLIMGASSLASQIDLQQSNSVLNRANARKANADATLSEIDANTRGAKNEADLALTLISKEQVSANIQKINSDIRNIDSSTILNEAKVETEKAHKDLTIAQTDSEKVHKMLIQSQTALSNANANQINSMLPFMKAYYSAEVALKGAQTDTEIEKATLTHNQAAQALLDCLKENTLLDNGYYNELTDKLKADTKLAERRRTNETVELYLGSFLKLVDTGVKGVVGVVNAATKVK